jgi:hypothetical protein
MYNEAETQSPHGTPFAALQSLARGSRQDKIQRTPAIGQVPRDL